MSDHQDLLDAVFRCEICPAEFGFRRPAGGGPYFKFPPTIGALGRAPLLFVGINPRISPDNEGLHRTIMADEHQFARLADNRTGEGQYVAPWGTEKHYHPHVRVVQRMFGEQARFEDYAAVTELFFCATRNAAGLDVVNSPCADRYFERVFLKVRPVVVFCVWKSGLRYFQRIARAGNQSGFVLKLGGHGAVVLEMPR